ncbi:sulfotransferase domain-containing protein [Roseofilum sp. Guam]|uniref:sulfotransferase domain-containing protein n=1 Tax=Roseofilum sp. Guam TaxID=2821502 RepID=UPI001B2B1BAE|nr:sulfotransferase domain-containing protein [Roseofilum sp. Guam]MBP0028019.1 sulfotransferase domain-containing protein [Roseofilum sp. Guam]
MIPNLKPSYTLHRNFRLPMGFPPENFDSALNYKAQKGDTFIVTYPKCGTTWVQNILWMLSHQGQPFPVGKQINREVPHLEEFGADFVKNSPQPRFIKTHFPYDLTPHHPEAKYIYIARNPFDCVVSFYYHTQGFIKHYNFAEGTFDSFFECFMKGEVDWGDYFAHLLSWVDRKDEENLLFLTYESIQEDTRLAVIKMADFISPDYRKIVEQEQTLEAIIYHASFSQMSKDQSRWSSERPDTLTPFIRKGKIGDWKRHFSADQQNRLMKKFREKTAGTAALSLWELSLFSGL